MEQFASGPNADRTLKTSRRRGSILPLTLIMMLTMGIVSLGVMNLVGSSLKMSQRRVDMTEALNTADAGADMGKQWLSLQASPPVSAALIFGGNSFFGTNGTITDPYGTGSGLVLTVRISADTGNTYASYTQKRYLIESKATMPSGASAIVRSYVQQTSFGHYAYFLDKWSSSGYWVSGLSAFNGPMHTNNSDGVPANILWKNGAGMAPLGQIWTYGGSDAFTSTVPSNWDLNNTYTPQVPSSTSDWNYTAAGGSQSVQDGTASNVPLPTSTSVQLTAALNGASVPTATGVLVTAGGGIYIHCKNSLTSSSLADPSPDNDVQTMTLGLSGTSQQILIQQNADDGKPLVTQLVLNGASGVTVQSCEFTSSPPDLVHDSNANLSTYHTYTVSGATNGVVYCDGNIGSQSYKVGPLYVNTMSGLAGTGSGKTGGVAGVVADGQQLTIATAPGKNLNIDGSVTYNTPPSSPNFLTKAGTLGMIANRVEVTDNDVNGNALVNMEVDADVFAYDTYDVIDYTSRSYNGGGNAPGTILNYGGYIAENFGFFATMYLNGQMTAGLRPTFNYDNRLGTKPPPYFATTGNLYDVLSWQRTGSLM